MVYEDQTSAFRSLIASSSNAAQSGQSSPSGSRSRSKVRASRYKKREEEEQEGLAKEFLREAYRIHNHLSALSAHLHSIRKPYLSLTGAPPSSRRRVIPSDSFDEAGRGGGGDDHERWHGVKYLTDREREEIDQRARMILRRCRERVGILEDGEKARQKRVMPPPSTLYTFLPSLAPAPTSPVDALVTAHRASVLWLLTSLLAKTSAELGDIQEERSKRRAERGRTLGEGAEKEARIIAAREERNFFTKTLDGLGATGAPSDKVRRSASGANGAANGYSNGLPPESDPALEQLTPAQIQAFESENNALLTHLESTLSSVLAAEKSLLEVSQLQTQLIQHLVQQTEMVDLLYDQAVGSVGEMKGAEQQLKKAKERSGEARLFLLVFLIGASLALLFLDWYS